MNFAWQTLLLFSPIVFEISIWIIDSYLLWICSFPLVNTSICYSVCERLLILALRWVDYKCTTLLQHIFQHSRLPWPIWESISCRVDCKLVMMCSVFSWNYFGMGHFSVLNISHVLDMVQWSVATMVVVRTGKRIASSGMVQ